MFRKIKLQSYDARRDEETERIKANANWTTCWTTYYTELIDVGLLVNVLSCLRSSYEKRKNDKCLVEK